MSQRMASAHLVFTAEARKAQAPLSHFVPPITFCFPQITSAHGPLMYFRHLFTSQKVFRIIWMFLSCIQLFILFIFPLKLKGCSIAAHILTAKKTYPMDRSGLIIFLFQPPIQITCYKCK